jgi:hypothetical protein
MTLYWHSTTSTAKYNKVDKIVGKKDIPYSPVPYKILKVYLKSTQSFIELFLYLGTRHTLLE